MELLVFHRDRRDEAPLQGAARVTKSQMIPEEVARGKDGAAPIKAHPAPKDPIPSSGEVGSGSAPAVETQEIHDPRPPHAWNDDSPGISQGVKLKKGRKSREGKDVRKSRMLLRQVRNPRLWEELKAIIQLL